MLRLDKVSKSYGGLSVLSDVSIHVQEGQMHGLIGPNGAGKSTLFKIATGYETPDQGEVWIEDRVVNGQPPHMRAAEGVAIVFQTARTFKELTVLENVMVGAYRWTTHGYFPAILRTPKHRREEKQSHEMALEAIERVGLGRLANVKADNLPLGYQRSIQLARAICTKPKLLFLDEPASGLRFQERAHLSQLLRELNQDGLTIFLIEHDVRMVSELCQEMTVLQLGEIICTGDPEEVRNDPRVVAAYIGGGTA